ncbi:MAG: hypothetical protein ACI87E_005204 [Mariniblastus sp.]|jgi:hypothetical protein
MTGKWGNHSPNASVLKLHTLGWVERHSVKAADIRLRKTVPELFRPAGPRTGLRQCVRAGDLRRFGSQVTATK